MKKNAPYTRKAHVFYIVIAIILFFFGAIIGSILLPAQRESKTEKNCRKFCEFIPNTEFDHVDSNNHCFCSQTNQLFDSKTNKTMTYTQIVDAGIITNVEIR